MSELKKLRQKYKESEKNNSIPTPLKKKKTIEPDSTAKNISEPEEKKERRGRKKKVVNFNDPKLIEFLESIDDVIFAVDKSKPHTRVLTFKLDSSWEADQKILSYIAKGIREHRGLTAFMRHVFSKLADEDK